MGIGDCDVCGSSNGNQLTENVYLCGDCRNTPRGEEILIQKDLYQALEKVDSHLTISQLMVQNLIGRVVTHDEDNPADTGGLPPRMLHHGVGLLWHFDERGSTGVTNFESVVTELHDAYGEIMDFDRKQAALTAGGQDTSLSSLHQLEQNIRKRELIAGRYAHAVQEKRVARVAYNPFSDYLLKDNGFDIEDAIRFTESAKEKYLRETLPVVEAFFDIVDEEELMFDDSPRFMTHDFIREPIVRGISEMSEDIFEMLWLDGSELFAQVPQQKWDRFERYLERLSAELGDDVGVPVGSDVSTFSQPYRCPYDINPAEERLFIASQGQFAFPLIQLAMETVSHTFYYDVLQSGIDEGEFRRKWGQYVEDIVYEDLIEVFGEENVIQNAKYTDPRHQGVGADEAEADILVICDDTLLVMECKATPLSAETRYGYGSLPDVEDAIRSGIETGYDQAMRLIEGIRQGTVESVSGQSRQVLIDPDQIDTYAPIVVMGDHYSELATHGFTQLVDIQDLAPYVADLYDLNTIAKDTTKSELLEYVCIRRWLNKADHCISSKDELDYYWAFREGLLNPQFVEFLHSFRFPTPKHSMSTNAESILKGADRMDLAEAISEEGLQAEISLGFDKNGYLDTLMLPIDGGHIRNRVFKEEAEQLVE